MSDIEREERYIVVKRKRIDGETESALREFLQSYQIPTEECVVVEHDWPNYEHTWETIQQVADGTWQSRAQSDGGEAEAVGFIPYSGLTNLAAGHPAKIYPVSATPSPFESHKLIYTHPPAANQGVPEGWKLVPVEPTGRMLKAGTMSRTLSEGGSDKIYKAMIDAAPEVNPPQQQEGGNDY